MRGSSDLSVTLKKGTLLIAEFGEYSDFYYESPLRMLKTYTKAQLIADYKAQWYPSSSYDDKPPPREFTDWLVKSGRAEIVENVHSWHIASYGEFDD